MNVPKIGDKVVYNGDTCIIHSTSQYANGNNFVSFEHKGTQVDINVRYLYQSANETWRIGVDEPVMHTAKPGILCITVSKYRELRANIALKNDALAELNIKIANLEKTINVQSELNTKLQAEVEKHVATISNIQQSIVTFAREINT